MDKMERLVSRRDFLKLAGVTGGALALPRWFLDPKEIGPTEILTGEVKEVKGFDIDNFRAETGAIVEEKHIHPFEVEVRGAKFGLVALPTLMDMEGEIVSEDKLFLQTNGKWKELVKSYDQIKSVVMWRFESREMCRLDDKESVWDLEPVMWYPVSRKNWAWLGYQGPVFAPPSEIMDTIPFYTRSRNGGAMIVRGNFPIGVEKALFDLEPENTCQIENFRDCPIGAEELFDGTVDKWLETLSRPFDAEKVKEVPLQRYVLGKDFEVIGYNIGTSPNFENLGEQIPPFRRDVVAGYIALEQDGKTYDYIFMPVEYWDKNTGQSCWVKLVYPVGDEKAETELIRIWREQMNITPIVTTNHLVDRATDPLVSMTFDNPDLLLEDKFESFVNGDVSALSDPKIVLLAGIGYFKGARLFE